jgi:hypothetical protein
MISPSDRLAGTTTSSVRHKRQLTTSISAAAAAIARLMLAVRDIRG